MLQECHLEAADFDLWKNDWGVGNIYINPYNTRSAGQVILLKRKENIIEHKVILEGRIQLLKIQISGLVLTLVNVYGPNKETERRPFLDRLHHILATYDFGEHLIIGGDFNIVPDNKMDKYTKAKSKRQQDNQTWSQNKLETIKQSFNLIDIWRCQHQSTKRYTWSQPNPTVRCRLDYFLVGQNLMNSSINTKILPSIRTDHSLIEITIKLKGPQRGPGIWKLNTSLLQEEKYIKEIKKCYK